MAGNGFFSIYVRMCKMSGDAAPHCAVAHSPVPHDVVRLGIITLAAACPGRLADALASTLQYAPCYSRIIGAKAPAIKAALLKIIGSAGSRLISLE